jgi:UDPglucose--hexose-1-phosphate uridylyltransferase
MSDHPHFEYTEAPHRRYNPLKGEWLLVSPQRVERPWHCHIESMQGICRVICFSPWHNLTLPEMDIPGIGKVVETWIDQTADLGRRFRWVQIFENKGDAMGYSNPHPHGQIWASSIIPDEPALEDRQQREYYQKHKVPLLKAYSDEELKRQIRIVTHNHHWLAVVPFWAK